MEGDHVGRDSPAMNCCDLISSRYFITSSPAFLPLELKESLSYWILLGNLLCINSFMYVSVYDIYRTHKKGNISDTLVGFKVSIYIQ